MTLIKILFFRSFSGHRIDSAARRPVPLARGRPAERLAGGTGWPAGPAAVLCGRTEPRLGRVLQHAPDQLDVGDGRGRDRVQDGARDDVLFGVFNF